ncbi:hypothetical protein BH11MYX3_BH11MYX3_27490 [soil metagenome]
MFDGETNTIAVGSELQAARCSEPWQELHAALKNIGVKRARLDAKELDLLFEAEEMGLFRRLGYPTMQAYMVAELECSRHTANEKLRVARELLELPAMSEELRAGRIGWTKVRELTRVATPETEDDWLDAIEGKDSTQVQQMVQGFKKGSRPGDRPDPNLVEEWCGLKLPGPIAALWRQVRIHLDNEAGRHLTDAELGEQLCKNTLIPVPTEGKPTRPPFQLAHTTCDGCKRAWQVGAGVTNEIRAAQLERVLCDSVLVGHLESEVPEAAQWSIPAPTRRKVEIRDRFACTFPGCTSKRHLEAHHVRPRAAGGGNLVWNLTLLCDLCRTRHKPHYAAYVIMPRRCSSPDEDRVLYAA